MVAFAHSGLATIGTREVAADIEETPRILGEVVGVRLLLGAASYALVAVVTLAAPLDRDLRWVVLGFGLSVFTVAADVRWLFVGIQSTRPVAVASVAASFVYLVAILVVVRSPGDLVLVPVAQVGTEALFAALLVRESIRRFGTWRPRFQRALVRSKLRPSLPINLTYGARTLTISLDLVLITVLLDPPQAGYYAAASRMTVLGILYLGLYYQAFLPSLVRAHAAGLEELRAVVGTAARRAARFAVPGGILATLAAAPVVRVLLGPRYEPTVVLLQVLVWSLVILALSGVYSMVILALKMHRRLAVNVGASLAVNVAANLALLPTVGVLGAAYATIAAEATALVLHYTAVRPVLGRGRDRARGEVSSAAQEQLDLLPPSGTQGV